MLTSFTSPNIMYYDNESLFSENYEDQSCDISRPHQVGIYITTVCFSIVVLLSLFGNIMVIVVLVNYENLKTISNVLIMNLAVSDLLFTTGLPFLLYSDVNEWIFGKLACKLTMFIFFVGYYSSTILLILMTAHRYVAVMNPLSSNVSNKGFLSALASPFIWSLSLLLATPAVISTDVLGHVNCVFVSSKWTLFGIYQQNVFFILNLMLFLFCYSQIIHRLLRPTVKSRKSKTLQLIFVLMVVFLVTWAPYNIVIFLQSLQFYPTSQDPSNSKTNCDFVKNMNYAFYITRLFAFSQCCLNPVFYVFVGVKFKKHLKKTLKSWGRKSQSSSIQGRQNRLTIVSVTSGEEFSM